MIRLANATVVHLDPPSVAPGTDVLLDGPRIAAVGPSALAAAARTAAAPRTIDLGGAILMPGLVCGHNHLYSALSRGILARVEASDDFVSILANLWWRLDRAIDGEILESSGLVGCVEAVRAGCTTVVDHHASPAFIGGSLDVLKGCFERVGLRGVLCYETTDRGGEAEMRAGVEENRRFAAAAERDRAARGEARLVEAMVGGHAPFTLPDGALEALGGVARDSGRGFHVHVSEDSFDPSFSHRRYGLDPLARLDRWGLLSGRSVVAHGVHLTEGDREILRARGSWLAHQARSNMGNRVGYTAALPALPRVVLGTDGIGSDMLEEAKFAYFKHRDAGGPLGPADFARFLQAGNDLAAASFGASFGRVEPGSMADLVALDYTPPTPLVDANVAGHLAFGLSSASVSTVIVGGRVVMERRAFPLDVEEIFARARSEARRLWDRMDSAPTSAR